MMKRNTPSARPPHPDFESFEDGLADLRGILNRSAASQDARGYRQDEYDQGEDDGDRQERGYYRQDAGAFPPAEDPYDYEQDGESYDYDSLPPRYDGWPLRRRSSISLRILLGVLAAAAVAVVFALLTSDATRAIIANTKEAIGGAAPDRADASAQPGPMETQLTAGDLQLKDPARFSAQLRQATGVVPASTAAPSRADVAAVDPGSSSYQDSPPPYQNAPQSRALLALPQAAARALAPAPLETNPVRQLPADELSALMRRARNLLAAGDIPSARLLLERAADAQEASAAYMLAETYDPQALGTQDARHIKPDPATARLWYQRAAEFGSPEAQRRLSRLSN
jgi:TPR repeat protein